MSIRKALPVALVLVVALMSTVRQRSHLQMVVAERDSIASSFKRYLRLRQAVVFAGDSLPAGRIVTADGDTLALDSLPGRGFRYLYFYREDCLACQTLAPLLSSADASVRDRTAYIRYSHSRQLNADAAPGHFAWVVDTSGPGPVGSVPALLVINANGVVTATADFEARSVVSLMSLHGLLSRARLDSAMAAARSGRLIAASAGDEAP